MVTSPLYLPILQTTTDRRTPRYKLFKKKISAARSDCSYLIIKLAVPSSQSKNSKASI